MSSGRRKSDFSAATARASLSTASRFRSPSPTILAAAATPTTLPCRSRTGVRLKMSHVGTRPARSDRSIMFIIGRPDASTCRSRISYRFARDCGKNAPARRPMTCRLSSTPHSRAIAGLAATYSRFIDFTKKGAFARFSNSRSSRSRSAAPRTRNSAPFRCSCTCRASSPHYAENLTNFMTIPQDLAGVNTYSYRLQIFLDKGATGSNAR